MKSIAVYPLSICTTADFLHDGHGLQGLHWHATDAWGFIAVAGIVAVPVWLSRK